MHGIASFLAMRGRNSPHRQAQYWLNGATPRHYSIQSKTYLDSGRPDGGVRHPICPLRAKQTVRYTSPFR
jgi:hypothetical protein